MKKIIFLVFCLGLFLAFTPVPESSAFQSGDEWKSIWGFWETTWGIPLWRYGVSDYKPEKPRLSSRGVLTPVVEAKQDRSDKELRQEVRQEIKGQIREILEEKLGKLESPTGTTAPTLKLKWPERLQNRLWEKIKEVLPGFLPSGVNRASITAILGTSVPTEINVIKDNKTITLKITEKTLLLRKFGGKSNLSELRVGDIVSARGTWEDSEKAVLNTRVLRDLSIQKRQGTFWGKIKSLETGNKTFVLETTPRGDQKVFVNDKTKIVDRRQQVISFTELAVGHRVRVTGLWDSGLKQIDEVRLIKDWSIGPTPKPTIY